MICQEYLPDYVRLNSNLLCFSLILFGIAIHPNSPNKVLIPNSSGHIDHWKCCKSNESEQTLFPSHQNEKQLYLLLLLLRNIRPQSKATHLRRLHLSLWDCCSFFFSFYTKLHTQRFDSSHFLASFVSHF